jgi:hypothetical protein
MAKLVRSCYKEAIVSTSVAKVRLTHVLLTLLTYYNIYRSLTKRLLTYYILSSTPKGSNKRNKYSWGWILFLPDPMVTCFRLAKQMRVTYTIIIPTTYSNYNGIGIHLYFQIINLAFTITASHTPYKHYHPKDRNHWNMYIGVSPTSGISGTGRWGIFNLSAIVSRCQRCSPWDTFHFNVGDARCKCHWLSHTEWAMFQMWQCVREMK